MKITYYNHASININSSRGFSLITDPWIYGPIYGGSVAVPCLPNRHKKYSKRWYLYLSYSS